MSRVCKVCGKGVASGNNNRTHPEKSKNTSNHQTRRKFKPNLFKKKIFDPATGKTEKIKICSSCLRTNVKVS